MEKPTYNPNRAVELQTFLEGLNARELRWIRGAAEVVLDRRVQEAERLLEETRDARFATDLEWNANGELIDNTPRCAPAEMFRGKAVRA